MDNIAKEKIQILTRGLSDLCLGEFNTHHNYTDEDLLNVTVIFSHVLMDILYTTNMNLPDNKKMELAGLTGTAIRTLIREATGKDMHVIVDKELIKNQ